MSRRPVVQLLQLVAGDDHRLDLGRRLCRHERQVAVCRREPGVATGGEQHRRRAVTRQRGIGTV